MKEKRSWWQSILNTFLTEKRDHPSNPSRDMLSMFAPAGNIPGITVTEETALTYASIFTCVRVIAETVAMLPCTLYKVDGRRRIHAKEHPLYSVLKHAFNEETTAMEGMELLGGHCSLRGNVYFERSINGAAQTIALWPLHPARMTIKRTQTKKLLYCYWQDGKEKQFHPEQILHVKTMSTDGVYGMSPISVLRSQVESGLAQDKSTAKLFGNGVRPSGVLEHPEEMSDEAYKRLKDSFYEQAVGIDNAYRPLILEDGTKWHQIGMSMDDAQAIDQKKYTRSEIVGAFRVPQHKAGILDKATFSNIEHQALEFIMDCILPWVRRIEQAMELRLLSENERNMGYIIRFNVNALLRGDIESRYRSYATARQNGWMNANEIRELEDMDPIPGEEGDKYQTQMNIAVGGGDPQAPAKKEKDPTSKRDAEDAHAESNLLILQAAGYNLSNTMRYVVEDQVERYLKREQKTLESRIRSGMKRSVEEFIADGTAAYAELQTVLSDYLLPTVRAYAKASGVESKLFEFTVSAEATRYASRSLDDLKAVLQETDRTKLVELLKVFVEKRMEQQASIVDAILVGLDKYAEAYIKSLQKVG